MDKIKFKDLSTSLKVFVILGWIVLGLYAFVFFDRIYIRNIGGIRNGRRTRRNKTK